MFPVMLQCLQMPVSTYPHPPPPPHTLHLGYMIKCVLSSQWSSFSNSKSEYWAVIFWTAILRRIQMAHLTSMIKYLCDKGYMVTVKGNWGRLTSHLWTLSICHICANTVMCPVCLSGCINGGSLFWEVIPEFRRGALERKNKKEETKLNRLSL